MIAPSWNIRPCARACLRCGAAFPDQTPLPSRLLLAPAEGYLRQDFCPDCWANRDAPLPDSPYPVPAASPVSDWTSTYRAPDPKTPPPLPHATAETLLRQYMETDDPANAPLLYLLAVMLERKRVLVEKTVTALPDGTHARLYEHKKTGESFLIPDPDLKLTELAPLQDRLASLLGLPPKKSPPPPDSPPSPS